jgi:UDP-N-acetylglucosamine--N-acetylmuramyl-(pentapeptide) pyrophosphoryl-undecaprenol N-acetylglucosamine transferase
MAGTSPAMTEKMSDTGYMGADRDMLILLAAGGTGGHLFPAQALAVALNKRGVRIALATDRRVAHFGGEFPAVSTHVIPSATLRGGDPLGLVRTVSTLTYGLVKAWITLRRLDPAAVVGFGGYPTLPPLFAAAMRGIPTVLHEQNAVMGRANRALASHVTAIAASFADVALLPEALKARVTVTGNPVRPNVIAAAATPYAPPQPNGALNLIVFGGSQGARVMADIVPDAVERLDPVLRARLSIVQQARGEDLPRVRDAYTRLDVKAEVAPFFADLPARLAQSHLVIARSGASTVAELSAIGRPAILVPLPGALDQDQLGNARVLEKAGGAVVIEQGEFTPAQAAAELSNLLTDPARLAAMAAGAKSAGTLDAADRLAELVMKVAGI